MKKKTIKSLIESKKGLTVQKLSEKTGISETVMQTLIDGSFGRFNVKSAIKLAGFFHLEVEDIDWRP